MNIKALVLNLKRLNNYIDWHLLLLLLLFLNVKLAVKIPAIILIYLLRFNFRFGFNSKNPRLPLFYPLIIIIALIDLAINKNYSTNYTLVFLSGVAFWGLCILAAHQVKLSVERNETEVINRTIVIFFVINAIISLLNLVYIVWQTGAINPYTYQGEYQKYFISTGDYVRGLTFDTSTTNAVLNAFGVIYFLTKKNAVMLLICMAVLLLTGSNFTNIILLFILTFIFIFNSTKDQKSLLVICLIFLVVFMGKISPQNNDYLVNTFKIVLYQKDFKSPWPTNPVLVTLRPDSTLNPEEKKQKIAMLYLDSIHKIVHKNDIVKARVNPLFIMVSGKIQLPKPDINSAPYQNLGTTPPEQRQLAEFVNTHRADLPISGQPARFIAIPGKVTGLLQTFNFYRQHPRKIITGTGMGNFSSKLAFRATGLKFTGGYPAKYVYINPVFLANHLDIYLNFFSKQASMHSLTNSPFSVYDQLLAEYGLLGLVVLFVFYLGFFAKHYRELTYGLPLLVFVLALFFIDYWFEQLSVMVMFELMLFLNIKENRILVKNPINNGR